MPKNADGSITLSVLFAKWSKDPEFMRAYNALEEEFAEEERRIKVRKAREAARLKREAAAKLAKQTAKPATPAKPRQPTEVVASK